MIGGRRHYEACHFLKNDGAILTLYFGTEVNVKKPGGIILIIAMAVLLTACGEKQEQTITPAYTEETQKQDSEKEELPVIELEESKSINQDTEQSTTAEKSTKESTTSVEKSIEESIEKSTTAQTEKLTEATVASTESLTEESTTAPTEEQTEESTKKSVELPFVPAK